MRIPQRKQAPTQEDLSLDPEVKELQEPSESEWQILNYVDDQFKTASDHRAPLEVDWALGVAFEEGRQWVGLSRQADQLISLINEEERHRYLTSPKVRPLLMKVESQATLASPDVRAVPLTDDPLDVQAAKEAEAIRGHCARKFDRHTQTKERVGWALKSSTCFLKIYWDDQKMNTIPVVDFAGNVNFEQAPVGDICEEILPAFSVFLDPTARTWEQVRWLIHAETRPLSYFVDKFGEKGKSVKPDAKRQNAINGYVNRYMNAGIGFASPVQTPGMGKGMDAAILKEYWEKPTAKFPKGRYIIIAGGVVLYNGTWPYKKNDDFPFVPLSYQGRSDSPYGRSLAGELISLQYTYNRILSAALEQAEQQVDFVAIAKGIGMQADAFDEIKGRGVRKIYYDATAGGPPMFSRSQGISGDKLAFLQKIERDMQDIAGVHDVTQGLAPAGTPAEAIRLLQQADQTQHASLRASIEKSAVQIAEWEVALYSEKAPLDVMLGLLDSKGTVEPQEPGMQPEEVMTGGKPLSMRGLREGGQYRVIYTPGSTLAEGPEEKNQKILTFYQMGLLGTPGTPSASRLAVTLMDLPETEKILRAIDEQEQREAENQAAMMEQQQQMMQSQMQNADPMTQLQMEAAKQQLQIETHQAKNQIERDADEETAQAQQIRDLQTMAVERLMAPQSQPSSTAGRNQRNNRGR
jgi:hypothetical protein